MRLAIDFNIMELIAKLFKKSLKRYGIYLRNCNFFEQKG